ncbi:DUF7946 domain-containing protein [Oceanicaulis alexandrii]|uniref:DUF7946 domain-containing protein n=1 Tax=Oceanicaulis alexandrii TaxID=153233 RepID=UPI0012EC74A6|nr:hypothetical protein [Oceanicaulis alexandrii]
MQDGWKLKYDGDLSSKGLMDLSLAGESLSGFGISFNRVIYYLEHQKVRYKGPYSEQNKVLISAPHKGSVEYDLAVLLSGPAAGLGYNLTSSFVYDFIKSVFRRATGQDSPDEVKSWERVATKGTFDAVADSVVDPLKRAHAPIGYSANNIYIFNGPASVQFNGDTKSFLEEEVFDPVSFEDIAVVNSMNGNNRSGRVYLSEEERGVSYILGEEVSDQTIDALLWSHSQYYRRRDANIAISYRAFRRPDGKVKRVIVDAAAMIED